MRILSRWFSDQSWLMEREALDQMLNVVYLRENDRALYEQLKAEVAEKISYKKNKKKIQRDRARAAESPYSDPWAFVDDKGIFHYTIDGELVPKTGALDALSGLQSYDAIQSDFEIALEDPNVKGFLLDYDSPGGTVQGIYETSDLITKIRESKPVVSFISGDMYSAAYWLGSNSDRIFATKSAGAGSIGVLSVHMDYSKKLEKTGVKPTIITAGRFKAEGNPMEPLKDETKDRIQSNLNGIYMEFLQQVSSKRNLTLESFDSWAEGRTFKATEALEVGLIDELASEEQAYQYLVSLIDTGPRSGSQASNQSVSQTMVKNMYTQEQMDEKINEINSLKASNQELKDKLEAKEKAEKTNLITQIGEFRKLSALDKTILEKCSNEELSAVLSEAKAEEKEEEKPAEQPQEEPKEEPKEEPAQEPAAKKVFVGAVQAAEQPQEKAKLSSVFYNVLNS